MTFKKILIYRLRYLVTVTFKLHQEVAVADPSCFMLTDLLQVVNSYLFTFSFCYRLYSGMQFLLMY